MSLRKFLLIPLGISLLFFAAYSTQVIDSIELLADTYHITAKFCLVLAIAATLQIIGHVIRAKKATILFRPTKESSTRFQFRALSIGYLFNTILPFKLGELIRARIISDGMTISFGFALVLIIFERAIDAIILGSLGLILVPIVIGLNQQDLMTYVLTLVTFAVLIFVLIRMLVRENRWLLTIWSKVTGWLNEGLKNSFRFKAWSIIYGLQRTIKPKLLVRYIGLSLLSWVFYLSSVTAIVQYLFAQFSIGQKALMSVAPYYGVGVPAGPANLGVFSKITNAFTAFLNLPNEQSVLFDLSAWVILVVPIALIGLLLLFTKTKETLWRKIPKHASHGSLMNKLYRTEDISSEMSGFLENYFSGNSLSKLVHNLELHDNFRLVKYFKGGSDAITILAIQNDKQIVKKIIPIEFEDRLKAQHDWLLERQKSKGIVKVLGEVKAKDYYAIDLEYNPLDIMFFDFIHKKTFAQSSKIMDEIWKILIKNVHKNIKTSRVHSKERQAYINKHIFGCLEKAASVNAELIMASEPAKITINGKQYDNLYQIMDKIKRHPQAWNDIASYKESGVVHGDVAVDNILISETSNDVTIIDPAPDGNIINGPVFDFGKNMQSLYCGYEFMLRDEDPVYFDDGAINYRDNTSAKYKHLCDYVRNTLAPRYLSDAEQKTMLFHAGALHIRRLKHQVYYNPANTLKFYAIGVKTLNDFLDQYS